MERNALRANLVRRAEQCPWGNLLRWQRGSAEDGKLLAAWANWVDQVNLPQTEAELETIRRSVGIGKRDRFDFGKLGKISLRSRETRKANCEIVTSLKSGLRLRAAEH